MMRDAEDEDQAEVIGNREGKTVPLQGLPCKALWGCHEPCELALLRKASSFPGHSDFPLTSP